MFRVTLLFAGLLAFVASCGPNAEQKQKEKQLADEVVTLHEEVMKLEPGTKAQALAQLKPQIDSLMKAYPKDSSALKEQIKKITEAEQKLNALKSNMDNWMANQGAQQPDANMKHEDVVKLYEEKKTALANMSKETKAALEEADSVLAAFEKKKAALVAKK
jgi:chromosome segregation ATPase